MATGSLTRTRLLVALIVFQVVGLVVFFTLAGSATDRALPEHAENLIADAGEQTRARTNAHLEAAANSSNLVVRSLARGDLSLEAPTELENHLLDTLELNPQIAGLFAADRAGNFVYVSRSEERAGSTYRTKIIHARPERSTTLRFRAADRTRIGADEDDPADTYDPRERPWYAGAMAAGGTTAWTEPYVFFSSGEPGITVSTAVLPGAGNDPSPDYVVGVDIGLSALSEFLRGLQLGDGGNAAILSAEGNLIALADPSMGDAAAGDTPPSLEALPESPLTEVVRAGRVGQFTLDDVGYHSAVIPLNQQGADWDLVVIAADDANLGALLDAQRRDNRFLVFFGLASALAILGALLTANRRLASSEDEARTDHLTGVVNRRGVMEHLSRLLSEDQRRVPTALAIIDIDRFKRINDNLGHHGGDAVITTVAHRIQEVARGYGLLVGRLGGDEFVAVGNGLEESDAVEAVEAMVERVQSEPIVATDSATVSVTVTCGLAYATETLEREDLLGYADGALFDAKRAGRNRVATVSYPGLTITALNEVPTTADHD